MCATTAGPTTWIFFQPAFVDRFARFAAAGARVQLDRTGAPGFYSPMNEISFFALGGDPRPDVPRTR